MARAQTPQKRRVVAALKLSAALERAADLTTEFLKAHLECADDPKAGDHNATHRLRDEMRELGGWLESSAKTWPTDSPSH